MLWEEQVPLLKEGYHKELVRIAYGQASLGQKVYPPRELVFNAMRITRFSDVRVVIIGQDPYFNEHQGGAPEAHGLCFSVREGIPAPPSLQNIFKEIDRSLYNGLRRTVSSDLTRWAVQGVLAVERESLGDRQKTQFSCKHWLASFDRRHYQDAIFKKGCYRLYVMGGIRPEKGNSY